MKNNRDILNEAFFKKASYEEKRDRRMAQYKPVDPNSSSGFASPAAYQVTSTDEVKKRLAGTFGVAFGNNNIRNMASRALKTFPIIISDNVEIETAVMLKKLLEEQYAEYINLLVSNQVVNLSNFSANDEKGNIAIQALDSLDGSDFSKSRIANTAARTGEINADSLFKNIPLYNLLKEKHDVYSCGNKITDTLLEGACIVNTTEEAEQLARFIVENADDICRLNEMPAPNMGVYPYDLGKPTLYGPGYGRNRHDSEEKNKDQQFNKNREYLNRHFLNNDNTDESDMPEKILKHEIATDARRGFAGLDDNGEEIYTRLTTPDAIVDEKRFNQAINRTVGDILTDKDNVELRDKFEKATFLLQSRMIAGIEFYNYCTMRLGIPVSDQARLRLIKDFKISDIRGYGKNVKVKHGKNGDVVYQADDEDISFNIDEDTARAIQQNRIPVNRALEQILSPKVSAIIGASTTAAGAGIGLGVGGLVSSTGAIAGVGAGVLGVLSSPLIFPAIVGALTGAASYGIFKILRKNKENTLKAQYAKQKTYIEGWERVEMLIRKMEEQQENIRSKRKDIYSQDLTAVSYDHNNDEYNKMLSYSKQNLSNALDSINKTVNNLAESDNNIFLSFNTMLKEFVDANSENIIETINELSKDKEYVATILSEKPLTQTMPIKVQYVEKDPNKDILYTPSFMARDNYAYGSTEIERRDNKDRRYNQPLIMTIRFKERFSDGKYSDNELTAVIGILGKIIRVPSDEMTYVLKENVNGNTIDGIFNAGGDLKNMISDMMSATKISKDVKSLPQSADIWKNLEKVATLAAANRLSGNRNGNLSNAHIIFSQKEIDNVRTETGVDYLRDVKKAVALMKRYSAFTLMIANDAGQRVYILDDQDNISWNAVPYSAIAGKDSGDQLSAALAKMARL